MPLMVKLYQHDEVADLEGLAISEFREILRDGDKTEFFYPTII